MTKKSSVKRTLDNANAKTSKDCVLGRGIKRFSDVLVQQIKQIFDNFLFI
jgi:hypothetical protein